MALLKHLRPLPAVTAPFTADSVRRVYEYKKLMALKRRQQQMDRKTQ